MIGCGDATDPHDRVPGLDRFFLRRYCDDDQRIAPRLRLERQEALPARETGHHILPGDSLEVVVAPIPRLHLHYQRQELAAGHRAVDRCLEPLGEREDRLLRDTKVGVRGGSLMQRHDRVEIGTQRLGLMLLRDLLWRRLWDRLPRVHDEGDVGLWWRA